MIWEMRLTVRRISRRKGGGDNTHDIRERKKDGKIKRKGGGHIRKDVRRSAFLKLKKDLAKQTRSRNDSSTAAEPQPDARAAQQMEDRAVSLAGGGRERASSGLSKVIRRVRQKRKLLRQARQRAKLTGEETRSAAENSAQPAPPAPVEEQTPEILRQGEKTSSSASVKQSNTASLPTAKEQIPVPKERARQTGIKDRQAQGLEIREKTVALPEREQAVPIRNRTPDNGQAKTESPFTPQERMRQKAVTEQQEKHMTQSREQTAPRTWPGASAQIPTPIPENTAPMPEAQAAHPTIRERPRRPTSPKEKPSGGAVQLKTRQATPPRARTTTSKTKTPTTAAQHQSSKAPSSAKTAGRQFILERGRKRAQREAQRQTLHGTQRAARAAAQTGKKLTTATVKTTKELFTALAGLLGGGTLVAMLCIVGLAAALLATPLGILFSNEPTPRAVPLNVAVGQITMELGQKLEDLQDGAYDGITLEGTLPDWREVVAVFAAKTSGARDGVDVASLTPDRVNRLRAVFWDMCDLDTDTETMYYPDSDPEDEEDDSYTAVFLTVTLTAKNAEEMRTAYAFSAYQNQALTELLEEDSALGPLLTDLTSAGEQTRDLLRSLPADLAPERRAVIEAACSLVGKVPYFWGGKSLVLGWDSRWGSIQRVWADGSATTGMYLPYGLDCSGFVDWAFYNATNGAYIIGHGGGAAMQHAHCIPIAWDEARPGDLVFYPNDDHVGIIGGRDEAGNLLIIHCAAASNGVTVTGAEGFTSVARPRYFAG